MISFGGAVAQGLEQSAHNRLVAGSNPASPTKRYYAPANTSRYFHIQPVHSQNLASGML
jgi:hypothetical protein